jgi:FlgD Ig-like domain/PKD domain/Acyl-coenzyme A:6-aminopenicillanic acid acyl-transferase
MRTMIIVLLLSIGAGIFACTIGVASGDVTATGRAMLWKTRDIASFPENYIEWNDESEYGFLYVRDERDSLAWMGVNEQGFCIANSYVERENNYRPIFNNGTLIYHLLGNCATISDMDAILDTLNISDQVLSGNFGVIDSTGAAAMYEISWTEVQKYNAAETDQGYIIRTNFSMLSGGSTGIERYTRSHDIIQELAEENRFNASSLMQQHFRDFSDDDSQAVAVPFYDRWYYDRPWGYIKTNSSICRGIAASSAVFESVLPGEPVNTTTLYALLGNPATSVYLPYFPIGDPPHQATSLTGMLLTTAANMIKSRLFNFPQNSYYIDSFNLLEPDSLRVFDVILPFDEQMVESTTEFLSDWRSGNATVFDAEIHSEYWVSEGFIELINLEQHISQEMKADFAASIYSGGYPLTVTFNNITRHYATDIYWDFDNDGVIDAFNLEMPTWTYTVPGTYSVRLNVSNPHGTDELILYDLIRVNDTSVDDIHVSSVPQLIGNFPNPLLAREGRANETEILFYLPETGKKTVIEIFNQRGRRVIKKVFEDTLNAGEHRWRWNGIDKKGKIVASGVYLYQLKVDDHKKITRKMTVIR